MQGVKRVGLGLLGSLEVFTVGFGDDDAVGHFHDAFLYSLELVAGPGQHEEQKEVNHAADLGFRLSDADGFDEDHVIAGCFHEQDGLTRVRGHAAKSKACRRRADEHIGVAAEALHSRFVAKDAAFGFLARRIHR